MLRQFGEIEVVFDTVNKKGMAMMQKKYRKQVGHADVALFDKSCIYFRSIVYIKNTDYSKNQKGK